MKRTKKILSLLLVAALTFTLIPAITLVVNEPAEAASDYAMIRQASVAGGYYRIDHTLKVNNVDNGTKLDYGYAGLNDVSIPSPVFIKSYQAQIGNYTGSTATLYIDRSTSISNVFNSGMNVSLYMANCTACYDNCVRWGVQLYTPYNGSSLGTLGYGYNKVTVSSSWGNSYQYTLVNQYGSEDSGCETAGGWTGDTRNSPETPYGPYTWWISGPVPGIGESVSIRVVGITVARAQSSNYQMHSEWIDLTFVGTCNHTQGYNNTVTPATCTAQGYTTHVCKTCGYTYTDSYTNALGHTWGSWTSINGSQHQRVCGRNGGHVETENHSFTDVVTPPTCTAQGYTTHTCGTCGYTYTDTYVNAQGHSWGAWSSINGTQHQRVCGRNSGHVETANHDFTSVVTGPTCTAQGYTTHTCDVCGFSYQDAYVSAQGHSWGAWTSISATQHQRVCGRNSGHTETENHSFTDVVTAPTCTAQGYTTHTCGICGYSYKDSYTDPVAHTYTVYVSEVTPATCLADATATYKCANCTATTVKAVPDTKLEHDYSGAVQCNNDGTHQKKCVNGCGEYGPAVNCTYNDVVTPPTCTEGGYTTHTCTVCGYAYTDAETEMNGHSFTAYVAEVTPATCLADATATYKCANCEETAVLDVPDTKLDHDYSGAVQCNNDGTHQKKCVNGCGEYGPAVNCTYDDVVTPPTCTEGGYTTHTCAVCGYSYTDTETGELGHSFTVQQEEVTPATCLADATANFKCERCEETEVHDVPDTKLGHDYSGEVKSNEDGTHAKKCVNGCEAYGPAEACDYKDEVTAPTCLDGGYTTHTCKVCGYSYRDNETEPTGHHFTEYVEEVTPATCEANATATYKCRDCDETTVKAVPDTKLSHDYSGDVLSGSDGTHQKKCVNGCGEYGPAVNCAYDDVVTPPTCTERGYTTHTCAVCGYSYTDTETEATGHHFTEYAALVSAGTCNANRVEKYKCADCDETEDREIPDSKDPENHAGGEKTESRNVTNANCVTPGSYDSVTVCLGCGRDISIEHFDGFTDPDTHTGNVRVETEDVVPGTCASPKTWNEVTYCVDCGAKLSSVQKTGEKDPAAHTGAVRVEEEDIVPGTCASVKTWNEVTYCAGCDAKLSSVPKTGAKDPENHTGAVRTEEEDIVPGTCASVRTWNEVTYCAGCDAKLSSVPKTGAKDPENHTGAVRTEEEDIVPGTCAAPKTWNEVSYCADCGEKLSSVPKTGAKDPENHTGRTETKIEDLKAATCVAKESWNEVVYCADCGVKLSSAPALGGLNPNNHAGPMEVRDRVDATADEGGYSGDTYCAACGTLVQKGSETHRTRGACAYCGGYHEGVWGSVVTAVHGILWLLRQLFRFGK